MRRRSQRRQQIEDRGGRDRCGEYPWDDDRRRNIETKENECSGDEAGQVERAIEFLGDRCTGKADVSVVVDAVCPGIVVRTVFPCVHGGAGLGSIEAQMQMRAAQRHGGDHHDEERYPDARQHSASIHTGDYP